MNKNTIKALLVSILVSFLGLYICSFFSSIINPSRDNSYLSMIICILLYISGIITFFGCLILYNIKNKKS
ncbi:threonine/homoserine/homoserine lactone efflux protein [Hathewaya limosa]|uniref:Threonine/homoserine/homoserine lactone efflux protein n=1 Tax=Hathewaya limosa TaxID=1536 RepID=A0ABU0JWP0_HATLI|nr:threonine/homoserine/homoserine lactone efflux protein [Hathewaya limosa]